jgi:hypothetical protein
MSCYRLIDAEKAHHPVSQLARVLGVARAGYHAWACRPPSDRDQSDALLGEQIRQIHARSRGTYGAPRIHAELRLGLGVHVSRKRVARLRREHGLQGVHRRRRGGLTRRDPAATPAPDLVQRRFAPPGPEPAVGCGSGAPRGAMDTCGGERPPPPSCRSRAVEAEGSLTWEMPGRVGAALTTPGRVGTARRSGPGKRDGEVYVRNQRLNAPQATHQLEPGGWGLGAAQPGGVDVYRRGARPVRITGPGGGGEGLRRTRRWSQGHSWAPIPSSGPW